MRPDKLKTNSVNTVSPRQIEVIASDCACQLLLKVQSEACGIPALLVGIQPRNQEQLTLINVTRIGARD